jgi:hypothetical protein
MCSSRLEETRSQDLMAFPCHFPAPSFISSYARLAALAVYPFYSQIQGPVSSSKCFSKCHKKTAPAAQIAANVINHTMITAQFDTQ